MYSTIKYEVKESIGYITINRPEALNALNKTVLEELFDVFNKIDADKDIRAVILTGEGRSFVAGTDISADVYAVGSRRPRFRSLWSESNEFHRKD